MHLDKSIISILGFVSQVLQLSQNGQILSTDGNQQIIQIPQQVKHAK